MIVIFNKPYQVLCQFTDEQKRETLANYLSIKEVYPAGRLDQDSEGLLLLTDDGKLQHQITHPRKKMAKSYWAQVEGTVKNEQITALKQGVHLKDGLTLPALVNEIDEPPIWKRTPPIRERKHIPTSWLNITLYEGRNRQVRRMTAHVGLPTLRLIRHQIGPWQLGNLMPGQYKIIK